MEEMPAVACLQKVASELGLLTTLHRVGDRANLISPPALSKSHELLLCSHIDTVPDYVNDLATHVRDGRLFGLGACDAKASVLAMMVAYCNILENEKLRDRVGLAIFVGEERDGDGAINFVNNGYKPKYAVIGEPTEITLPWGQAGYVNCVVRAKSAPRHAFSDRPSDSIESVIEAVYEIRAYVSQRGKGLPREERPSVFLEHIQGGTQDKFWCARQSCEASIVINTHPSWEIEDLISSLRLIVRNHSRKTRDLSLTLCVQSWDPGIAFDSKKLRSALEKGLEANNGIPERSYMRSWTDAATLAWKGVNTVVFGPGSLEVAHSKDENVLLEQVELAASVYRDAAILLLASGDCI
ncbi:MAG: M20/M25/M40 family metallo-hydrolase [Nitrososphaerales archaeon]